METFVRSYQLSSRQLFDVELILNGGFHPLTGFMTEADYASVLINLHLPNSVVWPIPITLDVSLKFAAEIQKGEIIILTDHESRPIAKMTITDCWRPDKTLEAKFVFGTEDEKHPGVYYLKHLAGEYYLGGQLSKIQLPKYYDFLPLRLSPSQLKQRFQELGWERIVAFQTRNPMHRAHLELTLRAASNYDANLLLHPVVGMTKPGDIDHYIRVRCYQKILQHYPRLTLLSLLPLAMRMAGPREALWHAIIRKNYGCTHFIVGRDHAGPGENSQGKSFYEPYAAQDLVRQYEKAIDIQIIPFQEMVYVQQRACYVPINEIQPNEDVLTISGTELRRRLNQGMDIPDWFSYPEIVGLLRDRYPPRCKQGYTLFFTGLSGAGKSTLANALMIKLMELGSRPITLLDGDIVRNHLSSELGFSKEHRDLNIKRIGFVAAEITKNGGIAICAPIAPYASARRYVREMIEAVGGFIEIYVATSLEVCEQRDVKGLYAKARALQLPNFTGISDPYEAPEQAELVIDTSLMTIESSLYSILILLKNLGYLRKDEWSSTVNLESEAALI